MKATIGRRAFLRQSAGIGVASGLGLSWLAACSGSVPSVAPTVPPGVAWNALARALAGRLVRPGDPGFIELARPNNLRYASILPAGIALCKNARDVRTSIRWAREYGVPLVARSGGHSYAGYSTTSGLMIDVREMTSIAFDRSTGVVTLGGGARNADVFTNFRKLGVAITHGRCMSVGVAGLTLGGGVGFNMRAHGLTCDQMLSSQIVTADGAIRDIGPSDADGLYWACRGAGGGNFGINTAFRFQTFDVHALTAYDLEWRQQTERVFAKLASVLESAPTTLGCKISAVTAKDDQNGSEPIVVQLLGQLDGSRKQLLEMLEPVYAIAPPTQERIVERSYWSAQDFLSEAGEPGYYQERSRFFDEPFDDTAVAAIFSWLRRWPARTRSASFKAFQTGGTVNRIRANATAFVHRNSRWLASIGLVWGEGTPDAAVQRDLEWQTGFYEAIVPIAKGGAYQNFIDSSLQDWKTAYYGANLPRLEAIKKRVDPTHVFTFPEAIP